MIKNEERKYFRGFKSHSERFINDKAKLQALLNESQERAEKYSNQLNDAWDSLQTLIRMTKAWLNGSYRKVSNKTIISIVTGIVYFVSPLDAIPDFIVGGFIDDIAVVGWIIANLRQEIEEFQAWENQNTGIDEMKHP